MPRHKLRIWLATVTFLPFLAGCEMQQPEEMGNVAAYKTLAEMHERAGNPAAAAEQYRAALAVKPHDAELLRSYGKVLLEMDLPAAAREQYNAALKVDESDAKALNGLAIALDYLGDHETAQSRYDDALRLEPNNLATLNNLAYSFILSGDYDAAIKKLEPHVKDKAATKSLRQNLALAYGLAGMESDAARVAKMDLSDKQVKESLKFYKRQRAEMAVTTSPYAEVGTYATEAMAAAEIERIKPHLDEAGGTLKPIIAPEVAAPGGTPRFVVRMMGCAKPDEVKTFCDIMSQNGLPCTAHER